MPKSEFKHKEVPRTGIDMLAMEEAGKGAERPDQAPVLESKTETIVVEERKLDFTERRNQPLPARCRRYFMSGR